MQRKKKGKMNEQMNERTIANHGWIQSGK